MIRSPHQERREVIPRWRSPEDAFNTDYISNREPSSLATTFSHRLHELQSAYGANGDLNVAHELISLAIICGDLRRAKKVANDILDAPNVSHIFHQTIRDIVEVIDHGSGREEQRLWGGDNTVPTRVDLSRAERSGIAERRKRLRTMPHDALSWVELGRMYALVAEQRAAARAIDVALSLSPGHRFVVRSAARFFMHVGEEDRARDVLLRSESLMHDPWQMAAEISVSAATGRQVRSASAGRLFLRNADAPARDIAELAASVATLELENGAYRSSRKLFERSLIDPTENVTAQAQWASDHLKSLELEPRHLAAERTYEARYLNALKMERWRDALHFCRAWLADQPFSSSPCLTGSYTASVALGDYSSALVFTERGLLSSPHNPHLLNNKAYALVQLGHLDDGMRAFAQALRYAKENMSRRMAVTLTATHGLLLFRSGFWAQAEAEYRTSIELAQPLREKNYLAQAHLNLANELRGYNDDEANAELERARKVVSKLPLGHHGELRAALERNERRHTVREAAVPKSIDGQFILPLSIQLD